MKQPVVIVGLGEIGAVFARGLLRTGYPVYPVTRDMDMNQVAHELAQPLMVIVAVAEKDLHPVLDTVPTAWRDRLVLLQNELLPADWRQHDLDSPTVISVWFEKKKGQDVKVVTSSPIKGDHSQVIIDALAALDIPAREIRSDDDLLFELVVKNLYILTSNISGLVTGGTVGELWTEHRDVGEAVLDDVIRLQTALTGQTFDHQQLTDAMLEAFRGDPDHKCMGRSAPARLERALKLAQNHQLELTTLRDIAARQ